MKPSFLPLVCRSVSSIAAVVLVGTWCEAAGADRASQDDVNKPSVKQNQPGSLKDPAPAAKSSLPESGTLKPVERESIDVTKVGAKSPWIELRNLKSRGDFAFDEDEAREIDAIYAAARDALQAVQPGPAAGTQKRAIKLEWAHEMEAFLNSHTNSAWAPGIALTVGNVSRERLAYSKAAQLYARAWDRTKDSSDGRTLQIADEAGRELAGILAMTGQLQLFDELIADAKSRLGEQAVSGWWWAREFGGWVRRYPDEAYKCGLACLDQLGRLTQPGQFSTTTIFYRASSFDGYSAADLTEIGKDTGVKANPVFLSDLSKLPVPCIVHLGIEHFVVVRQRNGYFYEVMDPVQSHSRWLTAEEIAEEATGCLLVSPYSDVSGVAALSPLSLAQAAQYRGRCYHGNAIDPNDGCPEESSNPDCPCVNGGDGGGGGPGGGGPGGGGPGGGGRGGGGPQADCFWGCGMPTWKVSEPYLNLWISDTPLHYTPAYGPEVKLTFCFHSRQDIQSIPLGSRLGGSMELYYSRLWWCSWLSAVVYDSSSGNQATVRLPDGSKYTFNFPGGGNVSSVLYYGSLWLEKRFSGQTLTGFWLYFGNGSRREYMTELDSDNFLMSAERDGAGNATTFTYYSSTYSKFLTRVTAADGTYFDIQHADMLDSESGASLITGVTASYGATVSIGYGETNNAPFEGWAESRLSSITDAAGIKNYVYADVAGVQRIVTPYGTTDFDVQGGVDPDPDVYPDTIERYVKVTRPNLSEELYGMMSIYTATNWPNWSTNQIPDTSSAPISTLDTTTRQGRNTFYWNAQQRQIMTNNPPDDTFDWTDFKKGRIRHWLVTTIEGYAHWGTLSWEQGASPDGGTTEGAVTWYDYAGKPGGNNFEQGTSPKPSVIARVMPDTTTWYQYFARNSIGNPTKQIERWSQGGSAYYRTNNFGYSTDGIDLLAITNAAGVVEARYEYDASHPHLPLRIINALNETNTFVYDTNHRVATNLMASGQALVYTYYGSGSGANSHRLLAEVGYLGSTAYRTNSYTWASNGSLLTQTDERGLVVTNTFDNLGRLTRVDYPGSTYVQHAYTNGAGVMLLDRTFTKDRLGFETRYEYNSLRALTKVTDPRANITAYGYCDCGALEYVTNAFGTALAETSHFVYDYRGRRVETYLPDGASVTNRYDLIGRMSVTSDALGSVTNTFDNLGRLVAVSNYFGRVQSIGYDLENQATNTVDANGVSVANTYDDLGRLRTRTYPDTGVEAFGYTANMAGITSYTNQLSNVWTYAYDAAGRKTNEIAVSMYTNSFSYKAAGELLTLKDGKTNVTTWNYDEYGRVTNKLDQASVEILRYKYDANSRLTNRWSKAKLDTSYLYDGVGNLTTIDYLTNTADITLSYDALNRLTNEVTAGLFTNKYTYYPGGLLAIEDGPWASDIVTNYYNTARLRSGLHLGQPTGTWTNGFTYDAARRLSTVVGTPGTFTYTYKDAGSLVDKLALPNTSYITNTYETVARLTGTYLKNSSHTTLNSHEYLYNAGNQRIRHTRTDASYYTNTYDAIGQLKVADSTTASEDRGYLYDAAWNLNTRTNNGATTTFSVNSKNELTAVATYYTCTYDNNGNLIGRIYDTNGPKTYTYEYNAENQLTAAYTDTYYTPAASRWKVEFSYDGRGRMRKRQTYSWLDPTGWYGSGGETRYVYDGMRVIQERDSSNTPMVAYTRGNDLSGSLEGAGGIGGLLARSHQYVSGSLTNHNYYHADGGGNITYMVNSSQSSVATYKYDPYGNTISSSGTLASANVYRFSSKAIHASSGMYYYGYRFYDPNLQRWLNRDPITEWGFRNLIHNRNYRRFNDSNLYRFTRNNPVDRVDPTGLSDKIKGNVVVVLCGATAKVGFDIGATVSESLGFGDWLARLVVPDNLCNPDPIPCPKRAPKAKTTKPPEEEECKYAGERIDYGRDPNVKMCLYDCPKQGRIEIYIGIGQECEKPTIRRPIVGPDPGPPYPP